MSSLHLIERNIVDLIAFVGSARRDGAISPGVSAWLRVHLEKQPDRAGRNQPRYVHVPETTASFHEEL